MQHRAVGVFLQPARWRYRHIDLAKFYICLFAFFLEFFAFSAKSQKQDGSQQLNIKTMTDN